MNKLLSTNNFNEKSKNKEVQKILKEIKIIHADGSDIFIEMRQIIFNFFPKADERIMYGGIVFFLNDEMFSGFVPSQLVERKLLALLTVVMNKFFW